MIMKHKTGVLVSGQLSKDPEVKQTTSGKEYMRFSVKAHSVKNDAEQWESTFVDVNIWSGIDRWDGMLFKGDYVQAIGRELKAREYNGKTYYSVDADGIFPDGMVTYRWLQTVIDMTQQPTAPVKDEDFSPVEDETPFESVRNPPRNVSNVSADKASASQQTALNDFDSRLIETDEDDLPF